MAQFCMKINLHFDQTHSFYLPLFDINDKNLEKLKILSKSYFDYASFESEPNDRKGEKIFQFMRTPKPNRGRCEEMVEFFKFSDSEFIWVWREIPMLWLRSSINLNEDRSKNNLAFDLSSLNRCQIEAKFILRKQIEGEIMLRSFFVKIDARSKNSEFENLKKFHHLLTLSSIRLRCYLGLINASPLTRSTPQL